MPPAGWVHTRIVATGTGMRRGGLTMVAGWFSFDDAEVTGGDLLAARTAERWLRDAGVDHRVAMAANFRRATDVAWAELDPGTVSHLVFVCGPLAGGPVEALFDRFAAATRVAAGVSVVDGTARLAPVELVARDGPGVARADLALGGSLRAAPVAGVVRSHDQPEYGDRQEHAAVHRHLDRLLLDADVAPVPLDTRLHPGEPHLCATPDQLVAAMARCDVIVTTRLHGLVLGLRAGVPVLAVDPVRGGAKVTAQARALEWPAVVGADQAGSPALDEALAWCLTPEATGRVTRSIAAGMRSLSDSSDRLLAALRPSLGGEW